jgi:general L-amino acid transport system permease protein
VLFIAQLMLPLLSPGLQTVPGVLRAMVGITLFSAAYLAENVRGGLQAVSHGQEEAARALGLSSFQVITRITLPQALRLVIPALVGQAISLFKDTTLVAIVGLFDLLRIADTSVAQAEFAGKRAETFFFIGIIYFIFSFLMTYVSRRIEDSGAGVMRHV